MFISHSAVTAGLPSGLFPSEFSLLETEPDSEVGLLECEDSTASPTTFSLENQEDVPFQLSQQIGGSNIARLLRTTELDYDTGAELYQLMVNCSDAEGSVSGIVTVRVLPVNDNEPQFTLDPEIITISEVTPAGTVIASQGGEGLGKITVSDADRGEDGVLEFSFLPIADDVIELTHFMINSTDGTITLNETIDTDIEFRASLDLEVRVCDGERPKTSCLVTVVLIVILPVNEFAPQFSQPHYNTTETAYDEGEYSELVIATVVCTDMDSHVGNLAGIKLISSLAPLTLVELSEGVVDVVMNGSLDYEVIRALRLDIQLICSDTGSSMKTATATLTLNVRSLDDNLPQFSQPLYLPEVLETLSLGSELTRVVCTDNDYGAGALAGVQLFNVSSEVNRTFTIDPETGRITLIRSLDYDAGLRSYKFSVLCSDTEGNEVTAGVTLTVLPANDERVQFIKSEYQFSVDRLELPGHVVGQLETLDRDLDPEQVISYSIENNRHFDIDNRGRIVLRHFVLFLEGDHFRLSVSASDGVNEQATALVIVEIDGYLSVLDIVLIISGIIVLSAVVGVVCCGYCVVRYRRYKRYVVLCFLI